MELTYIIDKSIEEIQSILTNLEIYANYHPLIYDVKSDSSYNGEGIRYLIYEKPYSFLPVRIKYEAIVIENGNQIEFKIFKIPLNTPNIRYDLTKIDESQTKIRFRVTVKGRFLVSTILKRKIISAQNILMKNIQRGLQNPQ